MMKSKNGNIIRDALASVLGLTTIIWIIQLVNMALHYRLCEYGIWPRTPVGLTGIFVSPFVHYGFEHLLTNTLPLVILGGIIAMSYPRLFIKVTVMVIILGGLGVWIFARPAYHVGASGLIFGYLGFLAARGWYERGVVPLLITFGVIFFYGGMIWGVFPVVPYISWEAHLSGLAADIMAARYLKK